MMVDPLVPPTPPAILAPQVFLYEPVLPRLAVLWFPASFSGPEPIPYSLTRLSDDFLYSCPFQLGCEACFSFIRGMYASVSSIRWRRFILLSDIVISRSNNNAR